jgi:hypothetical protein
VVGITSGDRVSGPAVWLRFGFVAAAIVCAALSVLAQTAGRDWQKGTWASSPTSRGRAAVRSYTIETSDFQYELEETAGRGADPLPAGAGQPVTFAVDKDAVFIRIDDATERQLRLVKTTRKLKTYASAGTGHFIKAIGEGGKTLTLEDGSVWEIEPGTQYEIGSVWQPLHGIDVRSSEEEDGFNYSLSNIDLDRGTMARLISETK